MISYAAILTFALSSANIYFFIFQSLIFTFFLFCAILFVKGGYPMPQQSNQCKHLQYAFFLLDNGDLFSCDEAGEHFLQTIDVDIFYSHLQCLKLNTANVTSTIIINNTSYSLRLISVISLDEKKNYNILDHFYAGNIVILQDQSYFSALIQKLNKSQFQANQYKEIIDGYGDGIFITRSDGTALLINSRYEKITGIRSEDVIGKSVYSMESLGYFTPLVTPTVLRTSRDYTVFQAFRTGKYAIICATPIYDTVGNVVMILICATPLTNPHLIQFSQQVFSPSATPTKDLYLDTQIDVIAESPEMRKITQDIVKVAHYDVPILLLGDSGTGKEVFSSILHTSSKRRYQPFIKVNCSAISPSLLEAELFGYEAGAFTGASAKGRSGLFESADNGTILLDEIGDMPLDSQSKLLRVLQSGEIHRVGGWNPIKVNTRIVASTNKNLRKMVAEGTFRGDLYYRLNVISIHLPSLKERRLDIIPLLLHHCYIFNKKYGTNKSFSPELLAYLSRYDWPGNVRELRNLVERMVIMCMDDRLTLERYLQIYQSDEQEQEWDDPFHGEIVAVKGLPPLEEAVRSVESILVSRALEKTGNTRKAAELLGVSQSTIMRKIKESGRTNPDL